MNSDLWLISVVTGNMKMNLAIFVLMFEYKLFYSLKFVDKNPPD